MATIKATGAEIIAFLEDKEFWNNRSGNGENWWVLNLDTGKEDPVWDPEMRTDEYQLNPDSTYSEMNNHSDFAIKYDETGEWLTPEDAYRLWRSDAQVEVFSVSIPRERSDDFRRAVEELGGKIGSSSTKFAESVEEKADHLIEGDYRNRKCANCGEELGPRERAYSSDRSSILDFCNPECVQAFEAKQKGFPVAEGRWGRVWFGDKELSIDSLSDSTVGEYRVIRGPGGPWGEEVFDGTYEECKKYVARMMSSSKNYAIVRVLPDGSHEEVD